MTITITATLDDADAAARLQALMARMDNRRGFLESVGDLLVGSAGRNFIGEHGPDGSPWTPLRPATIRARTKARRSQIRILSESGTLAGSIHAEATDDEVRIGSAVPYAAIHQLGGTIRKDAGSRWMAARRFAKRAERPDGAEKAIRAHTITIPARPFLGISPQDEVSILEMAERWLAG